MRDHKLGIAPKHERPLNKDRTMEAVFTAGILLVLVYLIGLVALVQSAPYA